MSYLIDDVARVVASPIPRRQALRFLGGAIATGIFGTLGAKLASAAGCPRGTTACGSVCCESGKICCNEAGYKPFCATNGKSCCGGNSCDGGHTCCRTGSKPFQVTRGKACCGNTACNKGSICCTTSSRPFCATGGKKCCGSTACGNGQACCNTVCCAAHQICKNGRCLASNV